VFHEPEWTGAVPGGEEIGKMIAAPGGGRPMADSLVGRTLASDVLHRLRRDITECTLRPGEKLRFETLRRAYGVSFSTLREALAHLVSEGLVVAEGQRGFTVAPMTQADLEDLVVVSALVEREALRLSFRHGDAAWEAKLHERGAALEELAAQLGPDHVRRREWWAAQRAFMDALVAACGSPTLLEVRSTLCERMWRYRTLAGTDQPSMAETLPALHILLAAALARDAEQAGNLAEGRYRRIASIILPLLDGMQPGS
jgi:DNA-binding GntR family transcriptional regulator